MGQGEFQENDRLFEEADDGGKVVMWLILYDRGYRAKMAAWLEGEAEGPLAASK